MTVFKTFLRVVEKNKFIVILYTVLLIVFSSAQMQTNDNSMNFEESRPTVFFINHDQDSKVTENLVRYMEERCEFKDIAKNEEAVSDALFYRDVNYIIVIPENYGADFLRGANPQIEVRSAGDAMASYAQMLLSRYLRTAEIYRAAGTQDEKALLARINDAVSKETQVEMTSKLDTNQLSRANKYYNFANYSILAGCIFVICIILCSFREEKINKRILVSSMAHKKHNRILLLSNCLLALVLCVIYVLVSFILVGKVMFTVHGLLYILNMLVFFICAVALAFLIGSIVSSKEAINGLVNVVALGSSFLCGAFVPARYLPDIVLKAAHILPSYWYIHNNDLLQNLETVNGQTLQPIFINMGVILLFAVVMVVLTNIITGRKSAIIRKL